MVTFQLCRSVTLSRGATLQVITWCDGEEAEAEAARLDHTSKRLVNGKE